MVPKWSQNLSKIDPGGGLEATWEPPLKQGVSKISFLMTWAYKDVPEMTKGLSEAYISAGNRNEAFVFPVGLAFQLAQEKFSDIDLYTPDKRHPSKAGTYLMAAVIYSSIYNDTPIGNTYDYGLGKDIQANLQEIAWETLKRYQGRK